MQPEDRHLSPYSTKEKFIRILWSITQATVFRYSFHFFLKVMFPDILMRDSSVELASTS